MSGARDTLAATSGAHPRKDLAEHLQRMCAFGTIERCLYSSDASTPGTFAHGVLSQLVALPAIETWMDARLRPRAWAALTPPRRS